MRAVLVVSGARRERAAALGPRAPAARSLAGARRSRHRAARWIRFGPRVAGAGAGPPVLGAAGLQPAGHHAHVAMWGLSCRRGG